MVQHSAHWFPNCKLFRLQHATPTTRFASNRTRVEYTFYNRCSQDPNHFFCGCLALFAINSSPLCQFSTWLTKVTHLHHLAKHYNATLEFLYLQQSFVHRTQHCEIFIQRYSRLYTMDIEPPCLRHPLCQYKNPKMWLHSNYPTLHFTTDSLFLNLFTGANAIMKNSSNTKTICQF